MTTRIETRLQRLEATTVDRAARESNRAVLQRLQAIEDTERDLTDEETRERIGAVIGLCGGTWVDVCTVAGATQSQDKLEV